MEPDRADPLKGSVVNKTRTVVTGVAALAAVSMSGSSLIVAVNALMLKRLKLPAPPAPGADTGSRAG